MYTQFHVLFCITAAIYIHYFRQEDPGEDTLMSEFITPRNGDDDDSNNDNDSDDDDDVSGGK